MGHLT